ncbi:MAG: PKD domain-containing protein [Deltaproteobacteria bacterium]|nr:PKD domain-containing protein [Deltaproteobacteria bacterium]
MCPIRTITNSAPVANAGVNQTANEGSPVTFNGTFTDGGTGHTFLWDFADGTTATTQSATHTYADNGAFTATFTVTDSGGSTGSDTALATISNVAPVLTSTAPSAYRPASVRSGARSISPHRSRRTASRRATSSFGK